MRADVERVYSYYPGYEADVAAGRPTADDVLTLAAAGFCPRCRCSPQTYPLFHPQIGTGQSFCCQVQLSGTGAPCWGLPLIREVQAQAVQETDKLGSAVEVNAAGGKQSKLQTRYDLFPPHAWAIVAEVLAQGAEKYDEWNWLKIPSASHLNHALTHINEMLKAQEGTMAPMDHTVVQLSEDHAAHAACRIMMWLEMLVREGKR